MMSRKLDAALIKKGGKKAANAKTGKAFVASQDVLEGKPKSKRGAVDCFGGSIGEVLYDAYIKSLDDSTVVNYHIYVTRSNPKSGSGTATVKELKQMYEKTEYRAFNAEAWANKFIGFPRSEPVEKKPFQLGWVPQC